jgi:hypothetical protein
LEYYNGVLFLTTNRIGKIDQAISSRIHIILHYKRLGQREIESVFRINMDRLRQTEEQQSGMTGQPPLVIVESDILQFAQDHCDKHPRGKGAWNGRQIRNAFIIAASLARDEAESQTCPGFQPQLRYSHFKQVEKLVTDYEQFRSHVLGGDDSRKARLNEERDDDYDQNEEEHTLSNQMEQVRLGYGMSQPQQPSGNMMNRPTSVGINNNNNNNNNNAMAQYSQPNRTMATWMNVAGNTSYSNSAQLSIEAPYSQPVQHQGFMGQAPPMSLQNNVLMGPQMQQTQTYNGMGHHQPVNPNPLMGNIRTTPQNAGQSLGAHHTNQRNASRGYISMKAPEDSQ